MSMSGIQHRIMQANGIVIHVAEAGAGPRCCSVMASPKRGTRGGTSSSRLRKTDFMQSYQLRGAHLLENAGHWVQQEKAREVNNLLNEFLCGLDLK